MPIRTMGTKPKGDGMDPERKKKLDLVRERLEKGFYKNPDVLRQSVEKMVIKTALDIEPHKNN